MSHFASDQFDTLLHRAGTALTFLSEQHALHQLNRKALAKSIARIQNPLGRRATMRRKALYQPSPEQFTLPLDPARNMHRFYSMAVERDLFGHVVLVRRWGRINSTGRTRLDEYRGEGEAMAAMFARETSKRRRGYELQRAKSPLVSFTGQAVGNGR